MQFSRFAGRVAAFLSRLGARAWFAYATILLLQLKRVWGMWEKKDLTGGDSSMYFCDVLIARAISAHKS